VVSLLGSAPRPVLPALVWAAFRLVREEPQAREGIEALLLPASLRVDGGRPESVSVALDVLIDLGLVSEHDGQLQATLSPGESDLEESLFRRELRHRVLASERNDDLFESDDGTREFAKASAWFLAQSVDDPPVSYNSVAQLLNEQFGSDEGAKSILQNSYRWAPFVRWAKYLGLASFVPLKDGGPCPDPVNAVRDALGDLSLQLPGEVELPHFVLALGNLVPVLDGGSYRVLVEERMDKRPRSSGNGDTVSAALSLALLRLSEEGAITLRRASDSPATRTLSIRQGHRERFSHIEIVDAEGVAA
jgi:hypothetical protein